MPEQDNNEKERLTDNTVGQKDAGQIASVRLSIAQYTREQFRLPSESVINDAEVIPPKSLIDDDTQPESKIVNFDPQSLSPDYSAVAGHYRGIRVKAQKAGLKKAA